MEGGVGAWISDSVEGDELVAFTDDKDAVFVTSAVSNATATDADANAVIDEGFEDFAVRGVEDFSFAHQIVSLPPQLGDDVGSLLEVDDAVCGVVEFTDEATGLDDWDQLLDILIKDLEGIDSFVLVDGFCFLEFSPELGQSLVGD